MVLCCGEASVEADGGSCCWTECLTSRPHRCPVSYDVTVRFEDSRGRRFELPYALDLDVYFGTMFMTIYGMYDAGPRARPRRVVAVLRSGRLPRP